MVKIGRLAMRFYGADLKIAPTRPRAGVPRLVAGGTVGDVDTSSSPTDTHLDALVSEWLDWHQAAELLGVSVSKVRQLIRDHHLAAAATSHGGQRVPAALLMEGQIVKGVPGTLTVLHDGGYDDREAIAWLFTPDDSLPGRPIDALRENRGTEVKRRAQAMAF